MNSLCVATAISMLALHVQVLSAQTVTPAAAFPGQIVQLEWTGPAGSSVKLDGSPVPAKFPTGTTGVSRAYVHVPPHAPGSVTVAVPGSGKTFPPLKILPEVPLPAPRIEDISIVSYAIKATDDDGVPTEVDVTLAVSASNLDLGAEVRVNRIMVPPGKVSVATAVPSEKFTTPPDPNLYAYPVFHTTLLFAQLDGWEFGGGVLTIEVRNKDAAPGPKRSAPKRFDLPLSMADLDSDGDGLFDEWEETTGSDFGCDPMKKDILVEIDWMKSAKPVIQRVDPTTGGTIKIWDEIKEVFSNAPVLNPDRSSGIRLYIDAGIIDGGDLIPDYGLIDFCPAVNHDQVNYYDVRSEFFSLERMGTFHYCVFAIGMPEGRSGRAEVWGSDLIVSVQDLAERWIFTDGGINLGVKEELLQKWQIGTFIHELGHNLALHHGGPEAAGADREELYKPNQFSSMNYLHQMCGLPEGVASSGSGVFGYSQGMRTPLDETTASGPPESIGGDECFNNIASETDGDRNYDFDAADRHFDYNEWGNLELSIPISDCMGCICYGAIQWNLTLVGGDSTGEWVEYHLKNVSSGSTISTDGGKSCQPPMISCGPGDTVECADYVAFVVVDCDTFYFKGDGDTVGLGSGRSGADTIRVTEGGVTVLSMVANLQDTISSSKPPLVTPKKGPLLSVSFNKNPLYGTHTVAGNITKVSDNSAIIVSGQDTTSLGLRFPTFSPSDTVALKDFNGAPGTLDTRWVGSLSKTDQVVSLLDGPNLGLGFIWVESEKPIRYEPIPGLVLAQEEPASKPTSNALKKVDVSIVDTTNKLSQGVLKEVQFGGATYKVFVHTSAYRNSNTEGDEVRKGYVLRAMILQK